MKWMAAIPLLLLMPGCFQPDSTYGVAGSFTAERTEDNLAELESLGEEHGGNVVFLESSPEQFVISGMEQQECEDLRVVLLEKDYLDTVSACGPDEESSAYD